MKCICKDMKNAGCYMNTTTYKSVNYNGFTLYENYGVWYLEFQDKPFDSNAIEIFYCPFCGRKLNHWRWAKARRKENFDKYIK